MLEPGERWRVDCADALAWLRALPDGYLSLVVTSPPYSDARTYGVGFKLRGQAWVDWLRPVIVEACRVTAGLVCLNVSAPVRKHRYMPAPEWLVADLTRHDGLVCGPSPYCWVRSGTPGSGSKRSGYHRRCWEPVYCFARPEVLPLAWHDQLAFGKPPRWGAGGAMSNRLTDGSRVNQWGGRVTSGRSRKADGMMQAPGRPSHRNAFGVSSTTTRRRPGGGGLESQGRSLKQVGPVPAIACPPNIIATGNGGNQCGHSLAHDSEAPMNLALAERLVCWFASPDSVVGDPFAGSGTTGHAALNHARRFLGCDLRPGKGGCETARRRLSLVTPGMFG
jgi:hypothetical protein